MSETDKPRADAPKPSAPEPPRSSGPPPKKLVPGAKVFASLGPPGAITATRHLSLDKPELIEPPVNRFSIYDVKAVKREILTIFDAAETGDIRAIVKFSKVKNFDVDAKDRYGRTALIWAADCGHIHAVETLIRLSCDIHATDNHTGRTAVHWAARSGNLAIIKLLVQYGANFTKEDRFGLTPAYLATSTGAQGLEVFEYLVSEGAPYNATKVIDVAAAEAEVAKTMEHIRNELEETEQTNQEPGASSSSS